MEEVKRKLDIVQVISQYVPLKKRGRHFVACCPFHSEKTPSFVVSPELQIYKCFGCGKAGDIFSFVEEYEKIDFHEALESLAKLAGIELVQSFQSSEADQTAKKLIEINTQVAKFYQYILLTHPLGKKALDYVTNRGLKTATIKEFAIGYSPADSRLIANYMTKKGYRPDDLVATGTFGFSQYGQRGLYDRFQDRLVFALKDYRGRILGFSGRSLPGSRPDSAKYINSPETPIYHKGHTVFGLNLTKDAIREQKSVIVVEGEFDLISPYQAGIKNIIALKGTAFTPEQLELLKRYTDTIILGLDSDFAGNAAARRSIELADNLGFDLHVLTLEGRYKDPDEAVTADPDFFKERLKTTLPIWDFLIQSAVDTYGIDTSKGKIQVLDTVMPFLVKINNVVIRSDYFKKLSFILDSSLEAILESAKKYSQPAITPRPIAPVTKNNDSPDRSAKLEYQLLTLILGARHPELVVQKNAAVLPLFKDHRYLAIAKLLSEIDSFSPALCAAKLPPELVALFNDLYLEGTTLDLDSDHRAKEVKKTITQLKIIDLKTRLKNFSREIYLLETKNETAKLKLKEKEYTQLLQELSLLQSAKT